MGFFNYIMKGMGFETEQAEKKPKKEKKEIKKEEKVEGKFDSLYMGSQIASESTPEVPSGLTYNAQENGTSISKNVIIYVPKSQGDIKNLIDFLRRKEPIIVNFSKIDDKIAPQMLSFISGALYALKGSIHPIADELFLLTPEGVNILVPKIAPKEDDFD